jgi:hypothetical protein
VLTPGIELHTSFPKIRPEEILIYFFIPLSFILNNLRPSRRILPILLIMIIFITLVLLSISYAYFMLKIDETYSDLTEIFITIKYIFLLMFVSALNWDNGKISKLVEVTIIFLSISCVIAVLQTIYPVEMSNLMSGYAAEIHRFNLINSINPRVFGTFSGPNQFSLGLLFGIVLLLSKLRFDYNNKNVILLLFFIFTLTLTGSRTAIASLAPVFILNILLSQNKILYGSMLLIGIFIFISVVTTMPYLDDFFVVILDPMSDGSFNSRWSIGYNRAMEFFVDSPLIGYGPAKAHIIGVSDSQYYYFLSRYGLIGVIWLCFYYFYPLMKAIKGPSQWRESLISVIVVFSSLVFVVTGLTSVSFSTIQFMDIWIPFLAIFFMSLNNNHNVRVEKKI